MELFVTDFEVDGVIASRWRRKNNSRIEFNVADDIGGMRNDETRLRQCLINLLP